ncbi:hypothetical protein crov314 [Cafeteria roenbergensis virus]|uniref:Uncharacterized protein n=1 Tax=Cafeteria roenbergensis virus (strain BV-PW1) TaxID=693272 RepID=E3T585_CROVB|nr:hypothetical protein crov314 [Cafeteria roenbergensis virus BV-PW1]ADO67348.1 hypothetical protein crov314 [Cafeteria roenbergensis virus BV-PW1]
MKFHEFTIKHLNKIQSNKIQVNSEIKPFLINFNNIETITIKKNNINNLIKSKFLPNEIYKEISKYQNTYSTQMDNLLLFFYADNNYNIKRQIKFIKYFNGINQFFKSLTKKPFDKLIKISIYFSPFKKFIKEEIISPININSGFTYNNNIIIFREEEWKKVLIHELIHVYGIDNYQFEVIPFINGLDMKYEALTEYIALIIHSQLISFISKTNFKTIIIDEIIFNIIQSNKILNHWKINKWNDFKKKKIIVKSSPFSYFIFKTELLINYSKHKYLLEQFILPEVNLTNLSNLLLIPYNLNDNNLRMTLYDII